MNIKYKKNINKVKPKGENLKIIRALWGRVECWPNSHNAHPQGLYTTYKPMLGGF